MTADAKQWLEATIATMRDCAGMFEAEGVEVLEVSGALPAHTGGAYISVVGSQQSAELGVVCSPDAQQALGQKFLGADAPLAPDEVADSMREMANIVAGGLKTMMVQYDPTLALGLPMFVDGVHLGSNTHTHVAKVSLAGQEVYLIVILRSSRAR